MYSRKPRTSYKDLSFLIVLYDRKTLKILLSYCFTNLIMKINNNQLHKQILKYIKTVLCCTAFWYYSDFWPEGPNELRKKICGVFECDIHLPEVLPPGITPRTFDCVTASFVLQAACSTDEELNNAVSHLASLLNPGGCLLTSDAYEATYFKIKDIEFPNLYLSSSNLSSAFRKAGLTQIYKRCIDFQPDKSYSDANQYGLYVAQKK